MNHIVLSGNLGADPEIRYSADGAPVATFNLAFRSGKDKTGWVKAVAFNKMAEVAETYLHKGARIALTGILDQNKWEGTDGIVRSNYQLIVSSMEFIKTDGRGFETENGGARQHDQADEEKIPF